MTENHDMCMAAIGLIGSVVQGIGAMQQSQAQAAEYKARALMNKRQAQIERIKGSYEAARIGDKGQRTFATQRAAFAEAGVRPEGSVADVITDSVYENQLDVQAVLWGQQIAGQNYDYQAKIDKMNA